MFKFAHIYIYIYKYTYINIYIYIYIYIYVAPPPKPTPELLRRYYIQGNSFSVLWELRHIFRAKGHMKQRARVMQRVVGATALWFMCAVPPDKAAMTALNSTQLQLMVWLLRFAKHQDESWEQFRQRAFRGARSALHAAGVERWSTLWLRRYWGYAGHRVRSILSTHPPISCDLEHFRTLPRWIHQKSLKGRGVKHKGRHYARLTVLEQNMDAVAGAPWRNLAHDRKAWKACEDRWVAHMDVPWSSVGSCRSATCSERRVSVTVLQIRGHRRLSSPP